MIYPPPPPHGIAKVLRSVSTICPSPNHQALIYPSNRQVQFTPKLPSMIFPLRGNCQGLIYPSNRQGLISVHGGGWVPTWSRWNLFTMDSPPSSAQHRDLTLLQETPCLCSLPTWEPHHAETHYPSKLKVFLFMQQVRTQDFRISGGVGQPWSTEIYRHSRVTFFMLFRWRIC